MIGPLPDTPKTYADATLGHLESALDFARLLAEKVAALEAENERLRETLDGMAWQFGIVTERDGKEHIGTMGLSSLEDAFEVLGWDDPHPFPEEATEG